MNFIFSISYIWDNLIIFPIDEFHHFSRWLKPPTSIDYIYIHLFRHIYTCIYLFTCSCIDILNQKNPSDWNYVHQLRDSEKKWGTLWRWKTLTLDPLLSFGTDGTDGTEVDGVLEMVNIQKN